MISRVWEATTAKRMQIDPYCQWRKCSPVNVVSSDIRVMQIFAGVREIWGVKQQSGRLRCRFSYLSVAIFSESSSPRHDKLTQCCRAFTLALARLSCIIWPNRHSHTRYGVCRRGPLRHTSHVGACVCMSISVFIQLTGELVLGGVQITVITNGKKHF